MITKNMVRKFSKRARGYMAAYKVLESDEMNENGEPTDITHKMIEKTKKVISSYRAALDFDKGYLNKLITVEGYNFVSKVNSDNLD